MELAQPGARTSRPLILAAFRVRSFRFQWPADLLVSWAFEMETLMLSWYVMVQTGSVLFLTAFASLQFLGSLAAPMFGVLGDRLGGRVMLCAMRGAYLGLAILVMLLALVGWLTPTWVFVLGTLTGIVRPNDQTLRNSLIGETIPRAHLIGALGFSRASADSARVAGALAGAGLSTALGIGPAYLVVTAFYLTSLGLTFGVSQRPPMPDPGAPPRPAGVASLELPRPSRLRDLKDGIVHVLTTPPLLAMMWLAFLVNLTAYPVSNGLLPYVARSVYRVDATGLGWLAASFSLGALLGSMAMVMTGGPRRSTRSVLVYTGLWYLALLAFGGVGTMSLGVLTLALAGFVQSVAMISMMGTLLAAAGDQFRTRVMGVRTLAVYGLPMGLMGSGLLIERVGFPLTIAVGCVVGLGCTILIGIRWRTSMWAGFASRRPTSIWVASGSDSRLPGGGSPSRDSIPLGSARAPRPAVDVGEERGLESSPEEEPMSAHALYLVRMDVAHDHETTFNDVYDKEHVPNLRGVPGVRRASRYRQSSPTEPRYIAAYELDSTKVLESAAWKAAGEAGRWPGEVRPHTMNRHRAMYEWVGGSGALTGKTPYLFLVMMDVEPHREALFNDLYDNEHLPLLMKLPGAVNAVRYRTSTAGEPRYLCAYEVENTQLPMSKLWNETSDIGRWKPEVRPYTFNKRYMVGERIGIA